MMGGERKYFGGGKHEIYSSYPLAKDRLAETIKWDTHKHTVLYPPLPDKDPTLDNS